MGKLIDYAMEIINKFDPTSKTNVGILAILSCVVIVQLLKSINSTFMEEALMKKKEKEKTAFFRIIVLLVLLTPINYILSKDYTFLGIEFLLGLVSLIFYKIYNRKVSQTNKYMDDLGELNLYYHEKCSDSALFGIVSFTPFISILMSISGKFISTFNCVVIVSIIEVYIIGISLPELVKRESRCYFISNNKTMYIYKRVDEYNILCGDNSKINEAKEYKIISYEDLKEKEIFCEQYSGLSKERKRKLKERYKEKKRQEKQNDTRQGGKKYGYLIIRIR